MSASGKVTVASSTTAADVSSTEPVEAKTEKVTTPKTFKARPVSPSKPYAAVTGAKEPLPSTAVPAEVKEESGDAAAVSKATPAAAKAKTADAKVTVAIPRIRSICVSYSYSVRVVRTSLPM